MLRKFCFRCLKHGTVKLRIYIPSSLAIRLASPGWTSVARRRLRLRFLALLVKMCRLPALFRFIFPLPVTRRRFAAERFVFSLGMVPSNVIFHKNTTLHDVNISMSTRASSYFFTRNVTSVRPSILGSCSTLAMSWRSSIILRRTSRPNS